MDVDRYNETIRGVVAKWERFNGMARGGRNHNLFKLAADLNNYGIRQTDALQVCLRYVDTGGNDPFTATEITKVVGSAYRGTQHGTKTWVPRGQYRRPGPRLPSPWTLPDHLRAAIVAKLVADMVVQDAVATSPAPPPPPERSASPPSAADVFAQMAERNNALFTLAQVIGLDLENAKITNLNTTRP